MAFDFGASETENAGKLSDAYFKKAYKECMAGHYVVAYNWLGKVIPPSDPEKRKAFDTFLYKVGDWANGERNREAQLKAADETAGAIDQARQQRSNEIDKLTQSINDLEFKINHPQ